MTSRDRILNLFREHPGQYVSGQEISEKLKVSRAAVWKQVKALRDLGFRIESKHSSGYRLLDSPDLLLAGDIGKDLGVKLIGSQVLSFAEIDSTNSHARHLGESGSPEGTVVIADQQNAGRGRLGRTWVSPSGVNLYCSVLLRPEIPVQEAPQLTFLSAVAVAQTLEECCGLRAQVKWPNDVLVDGLKIAGLLNEMNAETEQIHYVVLGMGINLNMSAEQMPERQNYPATSVLLQTGQEVDRTTFARTLLQLLDRYYNELLEHGFSPIRKRWEERCHIMGQRVSVTQTQGVVVGTVVGLDSDGSLLLETEDGDVRRIVSGDVKPL